MKIFIAIELEDDIKDYLDEMQKKVSERSRKGNFTSRNNYHITLRFLGEVDRDDVDTVVEAIHDASVRTKCFDININKLGAFVNGDTSTIWAGVDKNNGLSRLYTSVEKALEKQGFRRDRKPFTPHITLGRNVSVVGNPNNVLKQIGEVQKSVAVTKITLMESKFLGGKVSYYPLYVSNLK